MNPSIVIESREHRLINKSDAIDWMVEKNWMGSSGSRYAYPATQAYGSPRFGELIGDW